MCFNTVTHCIVLAGLELLKLLARIADRSHDLQLHDLLYCFILVLDTVWSLPPFVKVLTSPGCVAGGGALEVTGND